MKPEPTTFYSSDDYMMDGFSEGYAMCQLARDESFGWPLLDPDLDTNDPFNSRFGSEIDLSVFDSVAENCSREWSAKPEWSAKSEWSAKPEPLTIAPESWQQLALDMNCPRPRRPSIDSTSLTPALAALELPPEPVDELDSTALGFCRRADYPQKFQKMEESSPNPSIIEDYHPQSQGEKQSFGQYPQTLAEYAQGQYPYGCGEGVPSCPGDMITIGVYTRSERAAKLLRYRQKRARRNFSKRVLYGCRKRFADSRPRVGGRFVINENRVIKPKTFLKRGRPRKVALPLINYLAASFIFNNN